MNLLFYNICGDSWIELTKQEGQLPNPEIVRFSSNATTLPSGKTFGREQIIEALGYPMPKMENTSHLSYIDQEIIAFSSELGRSVFGKTERDRASLEANAKLATEQFQNLRWKQISEIAPR